MGDMPTIVLLAALAIAALSGSIVSVVRDGYRRVPARRA